MFDEVYPQEEQVRLRLVELLHEVGFTELRDYKIYKYDSLKVQTI